MIDGANTEISRRGAVAAVAAVGATLTPGIAVAVRTVSDPPSASDFAFQTGEWSVAHCKLKHRLAGDSTWIKFQGTCRAWEILGGEGNIEDNLLDDPSGAYRAAALRKLDPKTDLWSIWWFDARAEHPGPPVVGRFQGGIGTFVADDQLDGRPIKVRFIWSDISEQQAHWEQAFSADGGTTWETNWTMKFERTA